MKLDKRVIDRAMGDHGFRERMYDMIGDVECGARSLDREVYHRTLRDNEEYALSKKELRRIYYAAKRIVAMFEEAA